MTDDNIEEDDVEYDSGPFCIHFGTPGECEEECLACGHMCKDHPFGDECNLCDCKEIKR